MGRNTTGGVRLSLAAFYAAFFSFIGVMMPFWPVWLAHMDLNAHEIGAVLGAGIGIKLVSAPIAGHFADRSGERRRIIVALAAVALGTFALFVVTTSFWSILVVTLLFYAAWPPVMSLTETLTVAESRDRGFDYGSVRLWGSISFIACAIAAGQALTRSSPDLVLWLALAAVAATVATCLRLPDRRAPRRQALSLPIVEAARHRPLVRLLVACGLIQGSHAVYYAFGTLHWQAAGYSEAIIGALWAEGVVAEILVFALGGRLARRLGPGTLLVLAGLAGVFRWLGTGLTDALPALIVLQALHGVSFGAAHLAAMLFLGTQIGLNLAATAQSLYSGVVWGLFLGPLMFAAGWLYGTFAAFAFLAMVAIAAAGALVALPLVAHARPAPP